MTSPEAVRTDERDPRAGFIIVAVLWILGALATLATIYAVYVIDTAASFTVHDERLQGNALFEASIELAAAQVLASPATAAGGRITFRLGSATVTADYRSENARIDLNVAPPEMLARLFSGLGAQPGLAEVYAQRVVAWRSPPTPGTTNAAASDYRTAGVPYPPRGAPFPHPAELSLVAGIPAVLVDRAMPFLTVYSGMPQINLVDAAPEVLNALPGMSPGLLHTILAQRQAQPQNVQQLYAMLTPAAQQFAIVQGSKSVRVMPRIQFDSGQRMSADIVIFLLDSGNDPYRIVTWRDTSDDPATDERPRPRVLR